jgi:glucose/arabinose dehydrogenase
VLPNTTLALPESIPLGAYKLENALPGLTFGNPVNMAIPPGETKRMFIVQKGGIIRVIDDITSPTPTSQTFLDLSAKVSNVAERGLMGLAFHPNYASNGTFFVVYSDDVEPVPNPYPFLPTRHSILSRFKVSKDDPNQADSSSETIVIRQLDRDAGHQAGDLEFGPDGYLYLSIGDEGSQTEAYNNSQKITKNFFSGILRFDVDKLAGNLEPNPHVSLMTDSDGLAYYSIPADNPWVGASSFEGVSFAPDAVVRTEFYAVGLRNPWQMSFDPLTDELYLGDVGAFSREEINKIVAGGNYQWAYREGTVDGPKAANFPGIPPLYAYSRIGSPAAVIGGVVYRGSKLPDLEGAYIFGDHGLNRIWALREDEAGGVTVDVVAYEGGVTSFLADPNGEVLVADFEGKIWRLVEDATTAPVIPQTLTQTGAFADLETLTPNPGVFAYNPNLRFWSDHAKKSRWFSVPTLADKMTWHQDDHWIYPDGMVWVKHFDLELERGNPTSSKRVETRFLVKTSDSCYGLSYQWNDDDTEAYLVPADGIEINYIINDDGEPQTQTWQIPGRADCLSCHTSVAGDVLSFNTRQLNKSGSIFGANQNQLAALEEAGFFINDVDSVNNLPRFVTLDDTSQTIDTRIRSYLAVNCVSCHQPGGTGPDTWDARPELTLGETGLINGIASSYADDLDHRLIAPGNIEESFLLSRVSACCGFTRMPPLGTSELDTEAIQLISDWIMSLSGYEDYLDWRLAHFGSDSSAESEGGFDADGDFFSNYAEFLTKTNPNNSKDYWSFDLDIKTDTASFEFDHLANRSFVIEISQDLENWVIWDVDGNTPSFPASDLPESIIQGPVDAGATPKQFYRWRITTP